MRTLWLSSERMTVLIDVDADNIITAASPIVRKFVGLRVFTLAMWMSKQGGLRIEAL